MGAGAGMPRFRNTFVASSVCRTARLYWLWSNSLLLSIRLRTVRGSECRSSKLFEGTSTAIIVGSSEYVLLDTVCGNSFNQCSFAHPLAFVVAFTGAGPLLYVGVPPIKSLLNRYDACTPRSIVDGHAGGCSCCSLRLSSKHCNQMVRLTLGVIDRVVVCADTFQLHVRVQGLDGAVTAVIPVPPRLRA